MMTTNMPIAWLERLPSISMERNTDSWFDSIIGTMPIETPRIYPLNIRMTSGSEFRNPVSPNRAAIANTAEMTSESTPTAARSRLKICWVRST